MHSSWRTSCVSTISKLWVNNELQGYEDKATVPPYRKLRGDLRVRNAYGWSAVELHKDEEKILRSIPFAQSVSSMEALVRADGLVGMPGPPRESQFGTKYETSIHFDKSRLHHVLGMVRDIVLRWSLQLERDGILGDGMTFSPAEQRAATDATYHVNNFLGPVGNAQIAQSSSDVVQVNAPLTFQRAELEAFVAAARSAVANVNGSGEELIELEAELATIAAQAKSPKPKPEILRESLLTSRRVLEGMLGAGAVQAIPALAEMFAKLF
jgi:hypothetical protein